MNLIESIQRIAKNQLETEKPMQLMFGTVVSDLDGPLRVRLSEKVVLEGSALVRSPHSYHLYEYGTPLILLRDHGGQRWYVLEVPYHGELSGRNEEDQHIIESVTGLRAELDDHDDRLKNLENVRVLALEHDMYETGGKVPVLETTVNTDLAPKVNEMWEWYQAHKDDDQGGDG